MVGGGRSCADTHLRWEGHPRWDIRRRGASISIKAYQTSLPEACNAPPFEGDVSLWFDLISKHDPPPDAVPVDLIGRRWQRLFDTAGRQPVEIRMAAPGAAAKVQAADVSPRCEVDLAEFEVGAFGERWATFGLTAHGPSDSLAESIRHTAVVLGERRPPSLEDAFAMTLPEWLLRPGASWRHDIPLLRFRRPVRPEHRPPSLPTSAGS
ncbi:MAG TPA: hypothetical protein VFY73_09220 [Ideonella sp.]|uniref:hypothetical protein n=1 Tax=Ideonella sp. TaxID=1929293 RepID=UPI002E337FE9|nr:hypothetical protein [Ideonella sp.]HEX5684204.1 hypothetical protein [Ideonella sp.]